MKLPRNRRARGFTLVEMMVGISCGSIMLAAVMTAGVALQRSFMAVEGYSIAEGDQLRVQDYIAMDCRRCSTAAVANNTLTLTLPKYYQANGTPYTASSTTSNQAIKYGNGTTTISYYQSGSSFIRNINGVEKAIATNVSGFTVSPQDLTSSVSCTITFSPRFVYLPGPGPINGTTVYSNTFLRNASARN
jgi:prepilin-type N-terminal cleavage/methylation domain-containing protein